MRQLTDNYYWGIKYILRNKYYQNANNNILSEIIEITLNYLCIHLKCFFDL